MIEGSYLKMLTLLSNEFLLFLRTTLFRISLSRLKFPLKRLSNITPLNPHRYVFRPHQNRIWQDIQIKSIAFGPIHNPKHLLIYLRWTFVSFRRVIKFFLCCLMGFWQKHTIWKNEMSAMQRKIYNQTGNFFTIYARFVK